MDPETMAEMYKEFARRHNKQSKDLKSMSESINSMVKRLEYLENKIKEKNMETAWSINCKEENEKKLNDIVKDLEGKISTIDNKLKKSNLETLRQSVDDLKKDKDIMEQTSSEEIDQLNSKNKKWQIL